MSQTKRSVVAAGLIVVAVIFLVASCVLGIYIGVRRTEAYIDRSSQNSILMVMDQMQLPYQIRMEEAFSRLDDFERYLFPEEPRLVKTEDYARYFRVCLENYADNVLFLREDGSCLSVSGETGTLDLQNALDVLFRDGKKIAEYTVWDDKDVFVIAGAYSPFEVDGGDFRGIAFLLNMEKMQELFSLSGFRDQADVYVSDFSGRLTYIRSPSNQIESFRNYNLLKHFQEDENVPQAICDQITRDFQDKNPGILTISSEQGSCYLAYRPMSTLPYMLICQVPCSVVQSSLVDYQRVLISSGLIMMAALACMIAASAVAVIQARTAFQKAEFERCNSELQEKIAGELEIAKNEAERANAAKSTFLSNMSHDIRTPMNAILGLSALIERDAGDPEKVRAHVRKLNTSGQHLLALINDVLDMSKIESGKMVLSLSPVNLPELVSDISVIVRTQTAARQQEFAITLTAIRHPDILADRLRLNRILINLLSNAVKYTREGGHIRLDVEELSQVNDGKFTYCFTVSDDGRGMDPDFVSKVFDTFTRERQSSGNEIQGTGLGMAITRNLAELMGGAITVESCLGQGSTFRVCLSFEPVQQTGQEEKEASPAGQTDTALAGKKLLIVEDNDLNAEILISLMEMEQVICSRAADGSEAVEMFTSAPAGTYDGILMDIQMPVMNGYEATRAIRAMNTPQSRQIPIIAMTANAFSEDIEEALGAGMDAHVPKPIDMDLLKKTICSLLSRSQEKGHSS